MSPEMTQIVVAVVSAVLVFAVPIVSALLLRAINRAADWIERRSGLEIEAHHREALHLALETGALAAIARGIPPPQRPAFVASYARDSVRDAIQHFQPSEEHLASMSRAKLAALGAAGDAGGRG